MTQMWTEQAIAPAVRAWTRLLRAYASTTRSLSADLQERHGLTIKGVTKQITVTGTVTTPIADAHGNERIGLNLFASIDRTDFGVDWNQPLPSGEPSLANDVTIRADLQFVRPGGETS